MCVPEPTPALKAVSSEAIDTFVIQLESVPALRGSDAERACAVATDFSMSRRSSIPFRIFGTQFLCRVPLYQQRPMCQKSLHLSVKSACSFQGEL